MPQSGMITLKSFQSFMVNDGLLAKVVEAVKAGEKEARSTGDIQTFEVFYKGFRQNIAIGRVMVIPAKVADSRENFPIALLYGCLVREFGGEEMADLINYKIGDSEFDEYSKADLAAIKDKIFKNSEGNFESLIMFAPSWVNKREYVVFKFTKDDEKLSNLVRHLVFNAYFDPALSSAFNALMTDVSTDKLDVCNVTPKLNFPGIAENPLKDYPNMQKMGAGRKKIFLTKKTADAIEQSQLEPAELDVFEELNKVVEKGLGVTEPIADVATHQACGELPVVEVPNVGPGKAAESQEPPKPTKDLNGPEGTEPIGIELNEDGTPKREETGKEAAVKTAEPAAATAPALDKQETVLYNQQNGSDKEYRVVMTPAADGTWMVEAFNGKRGKATAKAQSFGPLNQAQAKVKYDELVAAKTSGGYTRSLEEQPKAPGQDALQALPARGTSSVIQLENPIQVALYKGMLIGQMSDGAWENSGPMDHWRPMSQAEVRVGKPGMNFSPRRTYGFVNLLNYVGDEMLDLARATKAYPNVDLSQLNHAIPYVVESKPEALKDDWQKKYVDAILKATGEADINQFLAKVNGQPYGMGELRKDLRGIQNVVNGQWHKENDARFASTMKVARDRNEEMEYNGHTFRLTTWEERDNLAIDLVDECCDRSILHLVDDDAREAIEDGFIDPRKMIQSAIEYAESMSILWDGDEDQGSGPMVDASSQHSREAAAKHEANLAKRYASRKLAEEVPTADSVLNEVLSDIGQAPIVNVPGTDNQPATQPETQGVPAPMKSEEPEQAKEQSAPEQEAKPFETTARKKTADEDVNQKMDAMGLTDEDLSLDDLYSKYGFSPIEQPEPTDQDLQEVGISREELEEEGGDFWNDVYFFQHPSGIVGTYSQDEGSWTLTKGIHGKPLADGSLGDGSLSKALAKIPTLRLPGKKKSSSQKIADVMDLLEGTGHYAYGRHMAEFVTGDLVDAANEITFDKSEMADNSDVDQKSPADLFASKTAEKENPGFEWAYCPKCKKTTRHAVKGDDKQCTTCHTIGPNIQHRALAADNRHDDVPVVEAGKPSEDKKQPASDLSGAAPEAHDAPATVDRKVAVGEMSEGVDPMLIDSVNEETAQMEDQDAASYRQRAEEAIENDEDVIYDVAANVGQIVGNVKHMDWFVEAVAQALMEQEELDKIDPLENAPGYREHSNALDVQNQAKWESYPEDPMTDEEFGTPNTK